MRKVSLAVSLVALLAASPVLADDNYSDIDQLAGTTDSSVTIDQTYLGATGLNQNFSKVLQRDNTTKTHATVIQTSNGQNNESRIDQAGTRSTAIVEQNTEVRADSGKNYSNIIQNGTGGSGERNFVTVEQEGNISDNDSRVDQNGAKLTTTIVQRGTNALNDSRVDQDGSDSTILVHQLGHTNNNTSDITQQTSGSTIEVRQGLASAGSGNINESFIDQFANDSEIYVTQGQLSSNLSHYSNIVQHGSDNEINVTQE